MNEEERAEGSPVGRRVVLGMLGLGAAGVAVGASVQDKVARTLAPVGSTTVENHRVTQKTRRSGL